MSLLRRFRRLAPLYGPHYGLSGQIFYRGLGFLYLLSFWSFAAQVVPLSGPTGLQPIGELMSYLQEQGPQPAALWFPSLFWLNTSATMLLGVCGLGMLAGVAMLWGFRPWIAGLLAWIAQVSLLQVCQPWLSAPGDFLLAEMGFVSLFMLPPSSRIYPPPEQMASRLSGFFLCNALLAKIFFSSGLAQLTTGESSWGNATALYHFFETQSLPSLPAWYVHHLPQTFLKYGVWGLVFIETAFPFYILLPRVYRNMAAGAASFLAVVWMVTGHYAFLPLSVILLAVTLIDDVSWRRLLPAGWSPPASTQLYRPGLRGRLLLLVLLPLMFLQAFPPGKWAVTRPWRGVESVLARVHASNRYQLFDAVPKKRLELSLQGSADGKQWVEYPFDLKPSDPRRLVPVSVLHLPRLDDQLVQLAARIGQEPSTPPPLWFQRLTNAILIGHPGVVGLLPVDPFSQTPPRFVRWGLYTYRFADPVMHREKNVWWIREALGLYWPVSTLGQPTPTPAPPPES